LEDKMSERSIRRANAREDERRARRSRRAAIAASAATGAAIFAGAPAAQAATFNVTNLNDTGAGSLRNAITQANGAAGPDTITFQAGLSGTIDVVGEMAITDTLDIEGPGADAITLDGGDANRILTASGAGAVSISGLTFANGSATGSGGAMFFSGTDLDLDAVVVSGNTATDEGGGVYLGGNYLTVSDSRFTGNTSVGYGGGLSTDGYNTPTPRTGDITISGSVFSGNEAGEAGGGFALYDNYVPVRVHATTVSGNAVTGAVGGSSYENGGGIWFEDTYDGYSTVLSNSTVTGNSALDAGGGVSFGENFYGTTKVVNSTITDNSADEGGGIQFNDIENAPFTLTNSTVTGNTAGDQGGGVLIGYADGASSSDADLDVSSAVITENTAANGDPELFRSTSSVGAATIGNSLLGNPAGFTYTATPAGSNIVGADPQLGPLADNGGPTETREPAETSPLIDAGLANGLSIDQRGATRTRDYPDVPSTHGSDGTDIGAIELKPKDTELLDPVIKVKKTQFVNKKVKIKVKAGAGEDVSAKASGRVKSKRGFPLKSVRRDAPAGDLVTLVLRPKDEDALDKVEGSFEKGKKVRAEVRASVKDKAGNVYREEFIVRLKPKE
jgi:hypothetical protein